MCHVLYRIELVIFLCGDILLRLFCSSSLCRIFFVDSRRFRKHTSFFYPENCLTSKFTTIEKKSIVRILFVCLLQLPSCNDASGSSSSFRYTFRQIILCSIKPKLTPEATAEYDACLVIFQPDLYDVNLRANMLPRMAIKLRMAVD